MTLSPKPEMRRSDIGASHPTWGVPKQGFPLQSQNFTSITRNDLIKRDEKLT